MRRIDERVKEKMNEDKVLRSSIPRWLIFLSKSNPNKIRIKPEFLLIWFLAIPNIIIPISFYFGNMKLLFFIPEIYILGLIAWALIIGVYKDKWKEYWSIKK